MAPKIDSFIENFNERDVNIGVITWLHDGTGVLEEDGLDLLMGEGIMSFHCGRPAERRGGGIGIFVRDSRVKAVNITPKDNTHEICAVLCSSFGTARKITVLGCYHTTALDEEQSGVFF